MSSVQIGVKPFCLPSVFIRTYPRSPRTLGADLSVPLENHRKEPVAPMHSRQRTQSTIANSSTQLCLLSEYALIFKLCNQRTDLDPPTPDPPATASTTCSHSSGSSEHVE